MKRWAVGVGVLGLAVSALAVPGMTSAGAQVPTGTGYFGCSLVGNVTFSPPWQSGTTGDVTATVDLSGPDALTCTGNAAHPKPTSLQATGQLTFKNGQCGSVRQSFTTEHTLKVTFVPVVHPSKFVFTHGRSGFTGTGYFSGFGAVKGSYPEPVQDGPELASTQGLVTGNCSTGITEISWSASTNPPRSLQFVGF
jgi:hypothetical protein